jgi:hypothetical protein
MHANAKHFLGEPMLGTPKKKSIWISDTLLIYDIY